MYDVIIIGAGVSGCASARELSRYKGKICVLEKLEDVCTGTSKANSGLVHAGYDAKHGTLMAKLNLIGNRMMPALSKELDISFKQTGSLVVAHTLEGIDKLHALYANGIANGVEGLEVITDLERISRMEPELVEDAMGVLYAPSAGIICPFELNIAMAENACANGVEFRFHTEVIHITEKEGYWVVETNQGTLETKYIVNAAGLYADILHNMVCQDPIHITPRKGEYFLLDKTTGNHVNHIIFALPTQYGKGILVTPTVHGNLLVGPTAMDVDEKDDLDITIEGMDAIRSMASMNVRNLPLHKVITSFAGNRAHEDNHEFIIKELENHPGFVDCAGIESPGITSSPAIGMMVCEIIQSKLELPINPNFNSTRKGIIKVNELTHEERKSFIDANPRYGNIICRCEMISEGEIVDAIHRPLGAKTVDGMKRRVRATAGRCQGGFCTPKILDIIHRECGIPMDEITKNSEKSLYITGVNKEI